MISARLLNDSRPTFETFKGNVCHLVKDMGDSEFLLEILRNDNINTLWNKGWNPESLYLLAMVDYISRVNEIPLCNKYDSLRKAKLNDVVYPDGVIILSAVLKSDEPKKRSLAQSIPEFLRFNIVECEVRDVH